MKIQIMANKTQIAVVIAAIVGVLLGAEIAYVYYTTRLNSTGIIASAEFEVYEDQHCTVPLNKIDWGICYPNTTKVMIFYCKNVGTVNTTLLFTTEDVTPYEAYSLIVTYTSITDNHLEPNEVAEIVVKLQIPYDARFKGFSFIIKIVSKG